MKIHTVDNYSLFNVDILTSKGERKKYLQNNDYYCLTNKPPKEISISLSNYISNKNNILFSFFDNEDKKRLKDQDDLIISTTKQINQERYIAQTGNYIGKFVWEGIEIDIKSRFNNQFLERMLNFANDVFLDDVSVFDAKEDKKNDLDLSKFVIYYMFIQKLEKAFLLGIPKSYRSIKHHEMKLKGRIDINRFIKNDIPFQGKVSSTSREQKEVQEIIDVLYKAISIIDKEAQKNNGITTKNVAHIKTHLKQNRSNTYVSSDTINKAMKSKALYNPIFTPYKKVLEYAKLIIDGSNLKESTGDKEKTFGFLVNVAELFEIYITKLLQKKFPTWNIESPQIELYENQFFTRKIIPDIVMMKDNNVLIFDTKYKRMLMRGRYQFGGDVDRCDFFQINSYMSYYQNSVHKDYNVVAGGLLYPLDGKFEKNICHSNNWFGNNRTKFIMDGIELYELPEANYDEDIFTPIVERENAFLNRIDKLINQT